MKAYFVPVLLRPLRRSAHTCAAVGWRHVEAVVERVVQCLGQPAQHELLGAPHRAALIKQERFLLGRAMR